MPLRSNLAGGASLVAGLVLGLPAGLAPGPMLTLVITQTLKHGTREGLKVAIVPLLSDAPVMTVSLWILTRLGNARPVVGAISLAGALFLIYLAIECLIMRRIESAAAPEQPRSIGKGVVVNLLNPHPYLFWFSVGSPLLMKAWRNGVAEAGAFLAGFYFCLVGSKLLLAVLAGRSRSLLTGGLYAWTMRVLGAALFVFAALFGREGLGLLGVSL